jgi:GWxTD domain-containing protein
MKRSVVWLGVAAVGLAGVWLRAAPQAVPQPRKELESPYRKWFNEDVTYIITDDERSAFKRLSTDGEREKFIEQFWLRRDPTPGTAENEFKDEHYRRLAYANQHFASQSPGWKTDRGRIYIVYGPPDEIVDHSSDSTAAFPFIDWTYRNLDGIGENVKIEFRDIAKSGEFHMTIDPKNFGTLGPPLQEVIH